MTGATSFGPGLGIDTSTGSCVPANAVRLNGHPITLNGQFITLAGRS
jgi:hypothetical protein